MYLIFDTATNHLANFKLPPEDPSQPRLIQLAALLLDIDFTERAAFCLIIKPEGFTIDNSSKAVSKHHITQELAEKFGVSEVATLHLFAAMCRRADTLVAHNIAFDGIVLGHAIAYRKMENLQLGTKQKYCTMQAMTPVCRIPGEYSDFKWPTLQEAHNHIGMGVIIHAHDALADVRACANIFQWLKQKEQQRKTAFDKATK